MPKNNTALQEKSQWIMPWIDGWYLISIRRFGAPIQGFVSSQALTGGWAFFAIKQQKTHTQWNNQHHHRWELRRICASKHIKDKYNRLNNYFTVSIVVFCVQKCVWNALQAFDLFFFWCPNSGHVWFSAAVMIGMIALLLLGAGVSYESKRTVLHVPFDSNACSIAAEWCLWKHVFRNTRVIASLLSFLTFSLE